MTRFVALVLALVSTAALADPADDAAAAVNRLRATAGLPPVAHDPTLDAGCAQHTEYLARNRGNPASAGLSAHEEQPDLPGASAAGAACGKTSDIAFGQPHARAPVMGFAAGIYHRRPILDPGLKTIGFGASRLPDGHYIVALRFDETSGKSSAWPVGYPADGQRDVPLEGGGETPLPIPRLPAGYPITLMFPPFAKVTKVHAQLTDAAGRDVEVYESDPEHPATSFPQLGIVSLIAKHTLAPDATYHVSIDAIWRGKQRRWQWSFTTLALRSFDAADRGAVKAALGKPSLARGKVTSAGTIADGHTVFLALGKGDPMVSVIVPEPVWREVAGRADPARWIGRTVEVQATPQHVGAKFINLQIAAGDQIRVVKRGN